MHYLRIWSIGSYDALTGQDYLSEEEAQAERQKFIELGRLAEQYRNPSRGKRLCISISYS